MSEGKELFHKGQIDELVAVAHELKTPLTIITHLAATLEDKTVHLDEQEHAIALERIRLSADRLLRLSHGLITSYRLDQANQMAFQFNLEPLNIRQLCEEVAHEITPFAKAHAQSVELYRLRPQLIVGNGDLVRSILFNLFDNAIRHNPPESKVQVKLVRSGAMVRVNVRDNGPGISRADLNTLRSKIGHQAQPLQKRSSGSGLGLYIAQHMAEVMGGQLGVGAGANWANFYVDFLRSKQMSLW